MTEAETGAAILNSMPVMNEGIGVYNAVGDGSGEQIDSSDEYDPAQDVQDVSLPSPSNNFSSIESSNNVSRPSSTVSHPHGFNLHTVSDTTRRQSSHQDSTTSQVTANTMANPADYAVSSIPSTSGLPKARLPNDTIGILEDRIKEDEKGDLDAWLNLINEYKRRNKLDDVRKVYGRFFAIFPQAVGTPFPYTHFMLTSSRQSNGLLLLNWRTKLAIVRESRACSIKRSKTFLIYSSGVHISTMFDVISISR